MLEIRPVSNEVVVGPKEALDTIELSGSVMSFAGADPIAAEITTGSYAEDGSIVDTEAFDCEVQVRAHGNPEAASAQIVEGRLVVRFVAPISGVAPGQSAVVYVGYRVLGQVTIDHTVSADHESLARA